MKDFGKKSIEVLTSRSLGGILALGGIGVGALLGGWSMVLAMGAVYAVERHGPALAASMDSLFKKFKNSRGVVAQMDFSLEGAPDKKYTMRYYVTD